MGEGAPKITPEEAIRPPKREPRLRAVEGPVGAVTKAEVKEPPRRHRWPWWTKTLATLGIMGAVGGGIEVADEQGVLPEPIKKPLDAGKKVVQEVGQEFAQGAVRVLEKAGVSFKTDQEIAAGISARANLSQASQESPNIAQTETKEQEKVKEFEGIKIELVTDPSFNNLTEKCQEMNDKFGQVKIEVPQMEKIEYREPVEESEKALEKAFLLTWAYTLRNRDPDFQNIPIENHDLLISTLVEKLSKGEDLTFEIPLKDNYSYLAKEQHITPYKVDLSRGVTLIFVGEVTGIEGKKGDLPTSRDFKILSYSGGEEEVVIGSALRNEVSEDGKMTMKLYVLNFRPENWTARVATCLETFIDPKVDYHTRGWMPEEKQLLNVLIPGIKWENEQMTKMEEWGTPILDVIYQE